MDSSILGEIYSRLSLYLAGSVSLEEFHNWLIPATWDIDAEPDKVKRLAHRLQLLLAEFSNGDRSEEDLRSSLWDLFPCTSVTVTVGDAPLLSRSTSLTQGVETAATQSFGRALAGERA